MKAKAKGSGSRPRAKSGAPARRRTATRARAPAMPEAVRRLGGWLFMALLGALCLAALAALRVPQMIAGTLGEAAGEGGFSLKHVEIKGAVHVPQLEVYNIAFDQPSSALPLVDLEGTRRRLLQFGWVRDARVSRRLPDTLVVDIVERKPAAIWQYNQQLSLIDREGVILAPVKLEAMPDLPLVIGLAANHHAAELARLVSAAPQLKPVMSGATWIGGRRWDLRFQSGEVLALPEGEQTAQRALANFARMDQATQLLGRGFARFDMRIPGKFVVRLSREPGVPLPSIAPSAPSPAPLRPAAPPAPSADVDVTKTI